MNLNDLYEMRDPRDAYERDVANSTSGFGKDSQAYRTDGGANDENHALDQKSSTWYIRLNGKLIKDKSGNPYAFQDKAAANKAALTMQAKLFNKDKEFMLTTNPNDKVAEIVDYDTLNQLASHPMAGPLVAAGGAAIGGAIGGGIKKTVDYFQKRKEQKAQAQRLGQQGMAEGAEFGANYAEQLAQKVFDVRPKLASDDDILNIGYKIAVQDLMSQVRANHLFARDQDFPSDFVTAYSYLQKQGMTEAEVDSDGHSVDHADSGEYDYEGDQAIDQLNTIVRAAQRLNGMLDDNENMPEWVQMKITNAADYIDTAADYIESNQEPELAEGDKIGNMDADKFDAAMARLKQLAGAGPMKTVYDPAKRVYRNVPTAVQPKK